MSSIPEFIRTEQNGIEYFTIVATGESGMSQRGLARACGKNISTVQNVIKQLTENKPIKRLERFQGKVLHLTENPIPTGKRGAGVLVYKADFCAATIKFYAYKGSEVAQDFDDAMGAIGLTSYIQGVTGWLPIALQSSQESRTALDRILDDAKPYKVFFEPLLYEKAVKLMGVKFYWHYCYDFLTMTERCKLNQVRQKTPQGRVDYIHQHISPATIPKLERYLDRLAVLVKQAKTAQQFRSMYQYQFYDNQQKEIDFDAD